MIPTLPSATTLGGNHDPAIVDYLETIREILVAITGGSDNDDDRYVSKSELLKARIIDVVDGENKYAAASVNDTNIRRPDMQTAGQALTIENVDSKLSPFLTGRVFQETFERDTFSKTWTNLSSHGTANEGGFTFGSGGVTGGRYMRTNGMMFYEFPVNIPYDRGRLHEMRIKLRKTANSTAQSGIYVGVSGIAADGVTRVDTAGGTNVLLAHYVCANAVNGNGLTLSAWNDYIGYFIGSGAYVPNASSSGSPSGINSLARYIRPIIAFNWTNGDGQFDIDHITVDIV